MKYTPRTSNFEYHADDIVGSLLKSQSSVEALKDAIAQQIDEYVEAVIEGQLEDRRFVAFLCEAEPEVHFALGERLDGYGHPDYFFKAIRLDDLLADLSADETEEDEKVIRTAEILERHAKRLRDQIARPKT